MQTTVAIHHRPGSFSDQWIKRCMELRVATRIVNCYDSSIVNELAQVQGLMWHWIHINPTDMLTARNLIASIEMMGLKVFPSTSTCWHFNDKIAQKYLLESVQAPLVPTYVFFDLHTALEWIDRAEFPKVFKLRAGAASTNVKLIRTRDQARGLAHRAFSRGFKPVANYFADFQTKARNARLHGDMLGKLKRLVPTISAIRSTNQMLGREKGYVYFQDFLPNNLFDVRITVIGGRALGLTKEVRPGDFRASGSGRIDFDPARIDLRCVSIALETASKIASQSVAFDFIFDDAGSPRLVEMSYSYPSWSVSGCPGYWTTDLTWHEGRVRSEDAILADFLRALNLPVSDRALTRLISEAAPDAFQEWQESNLARA